MAGLFKKPTMPAIADPTPMPDEDQTDAARKRGVAKEKARSGFDSTILSSGGRETLGG